MIADLKPYPAYKDSGVPWLGRVPEHWDVRRLKNAATNVVEQTAVARPGELYIALEHVEGWTGRVRTAAANTTFDSQVKRFRSNDVLFGKLRPYLAKVTRPAADGVCVGEFFVLRPRTPELLAPFLEHVLRSKPIIDVIDSSTFGAKMPRADWVFVGNLQVAFPTATEQSAIMHFLDDADRRIRRYIHAKRKLTALLKEEKQAIIHRAVTRGLDPNVRLKPSGVEWLGDVPEHWQAKRLNHLLNPAIPLAYGILLPGPRVDDGVPYLGAGDVRPERLRLEALPRTRSRLRIHGHRCDPASWSMP
jgi:type I restriction enzyme S subunit